MTNPMMNLKSLLEKAPDADAHAGLIAAALADTPDITLPELKERLAAQGASTGVTALWRSFRRHGITRKKTAHAAEQDRPDILTQREAWFDGQLDLDPEHLVLIDETWASTNMARRYGRAPRGSVCGRACRTGTGRPRPSSQACA